MSGRFLYDNDSLGSSDSDSDFAEVLYSSSSVDRSSIGSIPWAEDAIKQNQLDWERIERMFYNEEDLPQDQELRNEIIDWQKRFPHLRINGCQIKEKVNTEDKIQLDWPVSERLKPDKDTQLNRFSAKSLKPLSIKSESTKDDNLFGDNLRISSVSILSRKHVDTNNHKQNLTTNNDRFINFGLHNPLSPSRKSRYYVPSKTESLLLTTRPKEKYDISIAKLSSSASVVRMPSILSTSKQRNVFLEPLKFVLSSSPSARSVNANQRSKRKDDESHNSTRNGVNRNTIILPAIDMDQLNLHSLPIIRTNSNMITKQTGRSISAAFNHRQFSDSFSASNLKVSK